MNKINTKKLLFLDLKKNVSESKFLSFFYYFIRVIFNKGDEK